MEVIKKILVLAAIFALFWLVYWRKETEIDSKKNPIAFIRGVRYLSPILILYVAGYGVWCANDYKCSCLYGATQFFVYAGLLAAIFVPACYYQVTYYPDRIEQRFPFIVRTFPHNQIISIGEDGAYWVFHYADGRKFKLSGLLSGARHIYAIASNHSLQARRP